MKSIYKLPSLDSFDLFYPKKHKIILESQRNLNTYFGDKRKINYVFFHTNPQGQKYCFGKYGYGKNETIVTIGLILGDRWIKMEKR